LCVVRRRARPCPAIICFFLLIKTDLRQGERHIRLLVAVAVEATGGFETVFAGSLAAAGLPVVVVNPSQVRQPRGSTLRPYMGIAKRN
jgi:transposase